MRILLSVLATIMMVHSYTAMAQRQNEKTDYKKQHQPKFGIKAGYNFAKVIGSTTDFKPRSNNGYMASVFFSPSSKGGIGYRSEIIYSRQGFSFDESGKMQNIAQDYIYLPQLTTFTIAHLVQLQAGGQIGYLLNAKNTTSSTSGSQQSQVTDYLNRIDYGFAGGLEVYPIAGLIIGGRYNVSLGNIYKQYSTGTPSYSPFPFNPSDVKGKNAVVQFFIGYKF